MSASIPEEIPSDVLRQLLGIQFDGFNAEAIRQAAKAAGMTHKNLLLVLGVYVSIGNNINRLNGKVKDKDIAKSVKGVLTSSGISQDGELTLARVAHAFLPVLLSVRVGMNKAGLLRPAQFETSTPPIYCDLAFNGIFVESDDFCLKMGRIITKVGKTTLTDAECDQRTRAFAHLASAGMHADEKMAEGFRDGVNLKAWSGLA
jgi:hypothetical protein